MKRLVILLFSLMIITMFGKSENVVVAENNNQIAMNVATYNIAAGRGTDGAYDLMRIAEAIRETEADIIGLQEVDINWGNRSNYDHMMERLAEELDMYYYFAPIYDLAPETGREERRQFGVGLLSKYPIIDAANREITRLSTQDPNPAPSLSPGFLEATVNVNGAHVSVYVTHLDYRSDPFVREMQVSDMRDIMLENTYSILVGDMNARPTAPELSPLFQRFTDAWGINEAPGFTYPATNPDRRIDYIFTSQRMEVEGSHTYQTNAADHLPVVAEVKVIPGNHSSSIRGMQSLVEQLAERGDFANDRTVRSIQRHLDVLAYYEKKQREDKLIKHLLTFKTLIEQLNDRDWLSTDAYEEVLADTNYMIEYYQYE
ncbi:endonuclease/exonuclease/phosphatase family protein [Virgibacillus salexigens]|uniref:Endonuclease/exonuclease/phosphatase domain-containing protein n=1 Tax=Virgibacillus kapii TaxID=1638645 RepID=A0ABQ2DMA3_9BACI|nr:endonuclease/exonuclease/phosphatase family protein [Virgibacillus kapii]GGJ60270.1 hypothetical protein GCM10007111_22900 [Virgibacillus kapii]